MKGRGKETGQTESASGQVRKMAIVKNFPAHQAWKGSRSGGGEGSGGRGGLVRGGGAGVVLGGGREQSASNMSIKKKNLRGSRAQRCYLTSMGQIRSSIAGGGDLPGRPLARSSVASKCHGSPVSSRVWGSLKRV